LYNVCWIVDVSQNAEIWVTTGDEEKLLTREADLVGQSSPVDLNGTTTIIVDSEFTQQRIKGFGAALSNSAAYLFYNSPQREEVSQSFDQYQRQRACVSTRLLCRL
jgi:O-glycosyl hydrolase